MNEAAHKLRIIINIKEFFIIVLLQIFDIELTNDFIAVENLITLLKANTTLVL